MGLIRYGKQKIKKHFKKNPRRFINLVARSNEETALRNVDDVLSMLKEHRALDGHRLKKPRDIRRFARRLRAKINRRAK